jgi:Uma2 family endonuclease
MPEAAIKKATYDDLYSIPENMTGEIIDGELIVTPRPARRHVHAASALGSRVSAPYQFGEGGGPGGWIIYFEPEIHFGDKDIVVPDLAGWRKERLTTLPEEHRFMVSPDWICEILSPNTAQNDRILKMRLFARHLVPYTWLIDPALRTLEVFKLESGRWVLLDAFAKNEKICAEPFQEIEIDLDNLWLESMPQTSQ